MYSTLVFFGKQLIWAVIGISVMLIASRVDYPKWRHWCKSLLVCNFALLMMVWSPLGVRSHGATSWIKIKFFTLQPAEFAKITLVLFLADLLARRQQDLQGSLHRALMLFIVPAILIGLVVLQPDYGMAILLILGVGCLWFLSGAKFKHLTVIATVCTLLITVIFLTNANAKRRLNTYFNPTEASPASHYQIKQAKIAMGHGGLLGVGLGDGQQKMHFLPAPHTDFIFAVLAEELGFITSLAVLLGYGILIGCGFYVSIKSPDLFGALLSGGITLMLALGVLINIAVVTGSIPTTGLPLPLISYGGSSLMSSMIGLGIIANVSKNIGGVQSA